MSIPQATIDARIAIARKRYIATRLIELKAEFPAMSSLEMWELAVREFDGRASDEN